MPHEFGFGLKLIGLDFSVLPLLIDKEPNFMGALVMTSFVWSALSAESQQFFVLFMLKRDRWTFSESVTAAFSSFSTELRDELIETGFLLDCFAEHFAAIE